MNILSASYDEIRDAYKKFLESSNFAKNTIQTSCNTSLYLWRKSGKKVFWKVILDNNFENIAKKEIFEALTKDKNTHKYIYNYIFHLRKFRKFLETINKTPKETTIISKTKKKTYQIPTPCYTQLEYYLKKWSELENYNLQEKALNKLFFKLCPENKSISDILIKIATLNNFYSTNIFSVYTVAKNILILNDIDNRLKSGDETLVKDIKTVRINGKTKNFYSFATKFCSHHNPLDFPIYDSYVEKILLHFQKKDNFDKFTAKDLKNYPRFKATFTSFKEFYGLNNYSIKDIDRYIWLLGKKYFPKNYKNTTRL